jgi:hypothetical protein
LFPLDHACLSEQVATRDIARGTPIDFKRASAVRIQNLAPGSELRDICPKN